MTRRIQLGGFYRSLPMAVAEENGFYAEYDREVESGHFVDTFLSDGRYRPDIA